MTTTTAAATTEQDPTKALPLDFSGLGGRIKPDDSYPTPGEWLDNPALPADLVFQGDSEVTAFFRDQIDALGYIASRSDANRESIITQLYRLGNERRDIISQIIFNHLPVTRQGDAYVPEGYFHGDADLKPSFKATINVAATAQEKYPKLLFGVIGVEDLIVEGLAMPHSLTLSFGRTALTPWSIGLATYEPSMLTVTKNGENNNLPPVALRCVFCSADPEAINQSLAFAKEITADVFATPEQPDVAA